MSSPWAKIVAPEPVNLEVIMSEEIARDLLAKEIDKCAKEGNNLVCTSNNTFAMPKEALQQVSDTYKYSLNVYK